MNISEKIEQYSEELIDLRRDFHAHPELGFKEYRTSEIVYKYLQNCGLSVTRIASTGVVGLLEGTESGPTIMLRADMDALPIEEENVLPYISKNTGIMHACGHDGHTAMLMIASKILSECRDSLKGRIKFVFQPNEEGGGALNLIEQGVLENPQVDACFGLHLWNPLQHGVIGIKEGPIMAGRDQFTLTIKGKGGHTAAPHESSDPIICISDIIQSLQAVQTRESNPLHPNSIMFGTISGGTAPNIIPQEVKASGTIRYLFPEGTKTRDLYIQKIESAIRNICQVYQTKPYFDLERPFPILINNSRCVGLIKDVVKQCKSCSCENWTTMSMASEDFSEYTARVPGAFYFIGSNNKNYDKFAHHHPKFNFCEQALKLGVEMHARTALNYLI